MQPQFDRYYEELIETIAATDDSLLERYLDGGEIARDEAIARDEGSDEAHGALPALLRLVRRTNYGTQAVLSTIVELMPNAYEMEELHAFIGAEGDRRSRSTPTTTRRSPRSSSRRRPSRTSAT